MSLAKPRGRLTRGFDLLTDDGMVLGSLDGSYWRDGGKVHVGNDTWEIRRRGWTSFALVHRDIDEAVARSRGVFKTSIEVDHGGHRYRLVRQSVWRRGYTMFDGEIAIGSIEPTSVWTNAAEAQLPDPMPPQLQVFFIAVAAIHWRRQRESSAAAT